MVGQGLAKVAAAFCHSMPVSGSFSRSALNLASGARTGLSSLVTAAFVLLTLLFFTPLLYHLPKPALAAVIMLAVVSLLDLGAIRRSWRASRDDGMAATVDVRRHARLRAEYPERNADRHHHFAGDVHVRPHAAPGRDARASGRTMRAAEPLGSRAARADRHAAVRRIALFRERLVFRGDGPRARAEQSGPAIHRDRRERDQSSRRVRGRDAAHSRDAAAGKRNHAGGGRAQAAHKGRGRPNGARRPARSAKPLSDCGGGDRGLAPPQRARPCAIGS